MSDLPEWNLDDLYDGPQSPALAEDLKQAKAEAHAFRTRYQGRLAVMGGAELGRAIAEYESMSERLYKVMSYAQLYFAADVGDAERGRFQQTVHEQANEVSVETPEGRREYLVLAVSYDDPAGS